MDTKKIEEMIRTYPEKDKLPCPVAHFIAASLNVTPEAVGDVATAIKVKLYQCQLGLFGYVRKGVSEYKIVGRPVEIPGEVLDRIKSASKGGRIPCRELWDIADSAGILRSEVGNAADSLGIRVTPCQLGAFKGK